MRFSFFLILMIPTISFAQVKKFPGHTRGVEAIRKHQSRLPHIAKKYGKTIDDLQTFITNERSVVLNQNGDIYISDESLVSPYLDGTDSVINPQAAHIPDSETFKLHSRPGSPLKILLDLDGHTVTTPYWNGGNTINALPYDIDGMAGFSSDELVRIREIWLRVAEDFAPFDVDITTEEIPDAQLYSAGGGMRVILTPSSTWYGSAGGVAYLNSFTWGMPVPAWVFSKLLGNSPSKVAEAASHEIGHTLGLSHQTLYDESGNFVYEYNPGNSQWAPIMGNSYGKALTTWHHGTAYSGKTLQDDLALIRKILPVNIDEASGNLQTSSTPLKTIEEGGLITLRHTGMINFRADVDVLNVPLGAGSFSLNVSGPTHASNLDLKVRVLNSSGSIVADVNPFGSGPVALSLENLPADLYKVEVSTSGMDGYYTDYGLQGRYYITGTAQPNYDYPEDPVLNSAPTVSAGPDLKVILPESQVNLTGSATDKDGLVVSVEWRQISGPSFANLSSTNTSNIIASELVSGQYVFRFTAKDDSGSSSSDDVVVSVSASTTKKGGGGGGPRRK